MKSHPRNLDVVHHGLVLLSDGRGRGRPARLQLSKDLLCVQLPIAGSTSDAVPGQTSGSLAPFDALSMAESEQAETTARRVTIKRTQGGLGLSIKGGRDGSTALPVLISKVVPGMPAHATGQLFVGDIIVEVNGEPVAGKTHDEIVELLKTDGQQLTLLVKEQPQLAAYLRPSLQRGVRSGSALDRFYEPNTWKSSLKGAFSEFGIDAARNAAPPLATAASDDTDRWRTVTRVSLAMAYLTQYLWGTDTLRHHAFEVRAVDGTSSGVIHCEDRKALDQWIKYILAHIFALNLKSIRMSNKYLHSSEQISYIGWVNEWGSSAASTAISQAGGFFSSPKGTNPSLNTIATAAGQQQQQQQSEPRRVWQPRFLILKGGDLCVFETPPLSSDDLNKCLYLYKVYDVAVRVCRTGELKESKRAHCFWLETVTPTVKHLLNFDTSQQWEQFDAAYHRCVYDTIQAQQTRTFACSFDGRPSGLVFDVRQGISLYDIPTKKYVWQYRLDELASSSDDGRMHVQLVFRDARALNAAKQEIMDLECDEVYALVFALHAFFIAKVLAAEPEFLRANPLV